MSLERKERESKVVVPGEKIAIIEEFFPSANTYVKDGDILAKTIGTVSVDLKKRIINVESAKKPPLPRKDEIVYAVVTKIRDISASLNIFYIEDRDIFLYPFVGGTLHVINVSSSFVKSLYNVIGYSDIVRAKILVERPPPLILTLRGRDLGVILARCPSCLNPLKKKGYNLVCLRCKKTVKRKISVHYMVK